jgi:hypothetical protein
MTAVADRKGDVPLNIGDGILRHTRVPGEIAVAGALGTGAAISRT